MMKKKFKVILTIIIVAVCVTLFIGICVQRKNSNTNSNDLVDTEQGISPTNEEDYIKETNELQKQAYEGADYSFTLDKSAQEILLDDSMDEISFSMVSAEGNDSWRLYSAISQIAEATELPAESFVYTNILYNNETRSYSYVLVSGATTYHMLLSDDNIAYFKIVTE